MARRPGNAHLVDDEWRQRVRARLKELDWKRADLARAARVSKSTISELLDGVRDGCVDLPRIYAALDWEWNVAAPLVSADAGELLGIWERLSEFERGRLLERARNIFEDHVIAERKRSGKS